MNIIIVGASSGLGLEAARLLVAQGHRVGVAARRTELLLDFQRSAPQQIFVATIDVLSSTAPSQLEALIEEMGGMDIYLHSAGVGFANSELEVHKELQIIAVNGHSFTQMVTTAYHYFARTHRRGHIAAITSVAGTKGLGAAPAYSATKRFQSTYLQSLAQLSRIQGHSITITDIRPGFVDTAFIEKGNYPLVMPVEKVARSIVKALHQRKRVVTIDWKFRLIVAFWRCVPDFLWERIKIK